MQILRGPLNVNLAVKSYISQTLFYNQFLLLIFRLVHDRELQLFDGSRLINKDKYETIKQDNNLTDKDMAER